MCNTTRINTRSYWRDFAIFIFFVLQDFSPPSRLYKQGEGTVAGEMDPKKPHGAFHCSICDMFFWDSAAVAQHRASKKHRENTGELAREKLLFKKDSDVTAADIFALVARTKKGPSFEELRMSRKRDRCDEAAADDMDKYLDEVS